MRTVPTILISYVNGNQQNIEAGLLSSKLTLNVINSQLIQGQRLHTRLIQFKTPEKQLVYNVPCKDGQWAQR